MGRATAAICLAACAATIPLASGAVFPRTIAAGAQPQSAPAGDAERQARAACGTCHAFPQPEILPRENWRDEFVRMMFIRDGRTPPLGPPGIVNRTVQLPADMEAVLPFYIERAPQRLPAPETWPEPGATPVSFTRRALAVPGMPGTPAVSHVRLVDPRVLDRG